MKRAAQFLLIFWLLALLPGCGYQIGSPGRSELESVFENEFGFRPSTNVADLKGKTARFREGRCRWLSLAYDGATFMKMTNQNVTAATKEDLANPWKSRWSQDAILGGNPNAPRWWPKPLQPDSAQLYYREDYQTNFRKSYLFFWADPANSHIYVESVAWD